MSTKTSKIYGYARVSTKTQKEDRQIVALMEQGIPRRNIFVDKKSGKNFEREKYQRLIKRLKPGDALFIESIDRLGRNYKEILEQWRIITKEIQADVVVLDMPLLDTRQKESDLTGTFIADIVLRILCYVAQTERDFNHRRQAEGIAVAHTKGVKFGRKPKERPPLFYELADLWRSQAVSARAAARELGVTHRTFSLWALEYSATSNG